MMKQSTVAVIIASLIMVQLLPSVFVEANPLPFPFMGEMTPDSSTKPPLITIVNTIIDSNTASIKFQVEVGDSPTAFSYNPPTLENIYYTTDWNSSKAYIRQRSEYFMLLPELGQKDDQPYGRREFSYTLKLTSIPDGNHTVTLFAEENGLYLKQQNITAYLYGFTLIGSKEVNIFTDITPPTINIEPFANQKFFDTNVPLRFSVSEPYLKASYVLDRLNNVTVTDSAVLANLPFGLHNVTVYAWDNSGNVGASETVEFAVESPNSNLLESYPTAVITASAFTTAVAIILISLLLHRRYRKTPKQPFVTAHPLRNNLLSLRNTLLTKINKV